MENRNFHIKTIEKIIDTKETYELGECIRENLETKFVSIGEGGNADVYVAEGTPFEKICFKKLKEKPQIIYNDMDKEHEYQMKVRKLGVNTPLTLISLKTEEGEYLVMERINGYSVRDISKNNELLPKKFNYRTFCKSLDDQIAKMHNGGIYHRDLHEGNVMIDSEGLSVIIDFGTATEGTGSDFTYEESVSMYNEKAGNYTLVNGYFKDDLKMVKNIKAELKKFMTE